MAQLSVTHISYSEDTMEICKRTGKETAQAQAAVAREGPE